MGRSDRHADTPPQREAAHGLATENLGSRARIPGPATCYTVGTIGGVLGIAALAIALSPLGQHSHYWWTLVVIAVLAFINTITYLLWLPWLRRRRPAKALHVYNSDR